jgi:hypothetical protein
MTYLQIATEMYDWLARHQIRTAGIPAKIENQRLEFILPHPLQGALPVSMPVPEKALFRSHGVGLRLPEGSSGSFSLSVYDCGGIFDPVEGYVPGDHYATTYFGLLSALLYQETRNESCLERAREALVFHLSTFQDAYAFSLWGYHWDFKNVAFAETLKVLEPFLSVEERSSCRRVLKSWKESLQSKVSNWIAMRAYASLLRSGLAAGRIDRWRFRWRLRAVYRHQTADGCFDDNKGMSRPVQYHAYVVALLHRIYRIQPDAELRDRILRGIDYLLPFIDPDGDFNYLGRGHEQIFGYAVALYALEAARVLAPEREFSPYIKRIWSYLLEFKREGHFPLVLNSCPDRERCGWYDYHHLTVYNAFAAAWIMMTHQLKTENLTGESPPAENVFFPSTQTAVAACPGAFGVFCGGLPEYLSEAGITPHHLWLEPVGRIMSCPGGPSPARFGRLNRMEHVEKNVLAPIACVEGVWISPCGKRGSLEMPDQNRVVMRMDYGPFSLERTVRFREGVIGFHDRFRFHQAIRFRFLRIFNMPVENGRFRLRKSDSRILRFHGEGGEWQVSLLSTDFPSVRFDAGEKVKTARGWVTLFRLSLPDFKVKCDWEAAVQFEISSGERHFSEKEKIGG